MYLHLIYLAETSNPILEHPMSLVTHSVSLYTPHSNTCEPALSGNSKITRDHKVIQSGSASLDPDLQVSKKKNALLDVDVEYSSAILDHQCNSTAQTHCAWCHDHVLSGYTRQTRTRTSVGRWRFPQVRWYHEQLHVLSPCSHCFFCSCLSRNLLFSKVAFVALGHVFVMMALIFYVLFLIHWRDERPDVTLISSYSNFMRSNVWKISLPPNNSGAPGENQVLFRSLSLYVLFELYHPCLVLIIHDRVCIYRFWPPRSSSVGFFMFWY